VQFNIGWAQMAKYAQELFNLQHNTDCTSLSSLHAYEEQAIRTSLAVETLQESLKLADQSLPKVDES
jgi:energy-converting hydrogenase A subunit M